MSDRPRNGPVWATWLLILVGAVCLVAGVVYLTTPASSLPSYFPGHDAVVYGRRNKGGVAMIGLVVLSWAAAWFTTVRRRPEPAT